MPTESLTIGSTSTLPSPIVAPMLLAGSIVPSALTINSFEAPSPRKMSPLRMTVSLSASTTWLLKIFPSTTVITLTVFSISSVTHLQSRSIGQGSHAQTLRTTFVVVVMNVTTKLPALASGASSMSKLDWALISRFLVRITEEFSASTFDWPYASPSDRAAAVATARLASAWASVAETILPLVLAPFASMTIVSLPLISAPAPMVTLASALSRALPTLNREIAVLNAPATVTVVFDLARILPLTLLSARSSTRFARTRALLPMATEASTSTLASTMARAAAATMLEVVMVTRAVTSTPLSASITALFAALISTPCPTIVFAMLLMVILPLAPPAAAMLGILTPPNSPLNRDPNASPNVLPALPRTTIPTLANVSATIVMSLAVTWALFPSVVSAVVVMTASPDDDPPVTRPVLPPVTSTSPNDSALASNVTVSPAAMMALLPIMTLALVVTSTLALLEPPETKPAALLLAVAIAEL